MDIRTKIKETLGKASDALSRADEYLSNYPPYARIKSLAGWKWVPRLIAALMMVLTPMLVINDYHINDIYFYSNRNFYIVILCTLALFVLLCLLTDDLTAHALMLISAGLYCFAVARDTRDYFLAFGLCAVMCALVGYSKLKVPKFSRRSIYIMIGAAAVLVTAFVSAFCICEYNDYRTTCFDFGIFVQMFHYMKETGRCLTTCERDQLLSHFAVHFSPIYYLLLPLYYIFPSAHTLNIAQAVIVASGVIPLVKLCRKRGLPDIAAAVLSVCWLMYPSFVGGETWDLHENGFLPPLIMWMVYFCESENTLGSLISTILLLMVKEDAAVYAAVIALYFIIAKKENRKVNVGIFVLVIASFLVITRLMGMYGEGIMEYRYGNYIYDDGGLATIFKALIQNPAYAIKLMFDADKLKFTLQMLVPLCFIPVMIKDPKRLILLIPFVLFNLMTDYSYQYDVRYQYAFGSGALLFALAVYNLSEMRPGRGKLILCAGICSIIVFTAGCSQSLDFILNYKNNAPERSAVTQVLSCIPDDASVSASSYLQPNLAQRAEVYELESTAHRADYAVVDLRNNYSAEYIDKYERYGYTLIAYYEGCAAVLKK